LVGVFYQPKPHYNSVWKEDQMSTLGRRLLGAILGGLMGLTYALISLVINRITMHGISLYSAPPGLTGQILLTFLLGLAIGIIACWPESGVLGVFLGGLVSAVLMLVATYFNVLGTNESIGVISIMTLYIFLPMIVMALPIPLLIRWCSASLVPVDPNEPINLRKGVMPIIFTIALTVVVGSLSFYTSHARQSLREMDALVKNGQEAASTADLPDPLQSLEGFLSNAQDSYTLEWSEGADKFKGQRLMTESDSDQGTVTVRFKNGFSFVCLFIPQARQPACEN
jgi:hypothetical protein